MSDLPDGELPETPRVGDLDVDPALASAVLEIEHHASSLGWDQPARLYALVDTAQLVLHEPALAAAMGLDDAAEQGSLTAVEQEGLDPGVPLERSLESITWPAGVTGCAAVVERNVLPPEADAEIPEDPDEAAAYAAAHPARQELRMVAGATRAGATYCAMRFRSHDDDTKVVGGADLVPALLELLAATLADPVDHTEHADDEEHHRP